MVNFMWVTLVTVVTLYIVKKKKKHEISVQLNFN